MGQSGGRMGGEWNGMEWNGMGGGNLGDTGMGPLSSLDFPPAGAPSPTAAFLLGISNDPCPPTSGCLPWLALRCL